jgi:hypothetical protein
VILYISDTIVCESQVFAEVAGWHCLAITGGVTTPARSLYAMYEDNEAARQAAHQLAMRRLFQSLTLFISLLITVLNNTLDDQSTLTREPYHTSVLTGEGWVMELLEGHPKRIQSELGVSRDVFLELIGELRGMGHGDSRYVSLEEQLAIFLYMSVTGLIIRHVGERFQRSNETVSK